MRRITMTSVAALVALPMAILPLWAQDATAPDTPSTQDEGTPAPSAEVEGGGSVAGEDGASDDAGDGAMSQPEGSGGDGAMSQPGGSAGDGAMSPGTAGDQASGDMEGADQVVVTVGDVEITAGQVRDAIATLPPQVQQNSPDVLIPFAVEQMVLRELILAKAADENLAEDPEVQELAGDGGPDMQDAALVQVYVQRQMEDVASDEEVQSTYDAAAETATQPLPPLEEVRPQIEQQLQQQKLLEIRDTLKEEYEVTYYGPDGEPRTDTAADPESGTSGGATSESGMSDSDTSGGDAEGAMSGTGTPESGMSGDDASSSEGESPEATGGGMDGGDDSDGGSD